MSRNQSSVCVSYALAAFISLALLSACGGGSGSPPVQQDQQSSTSQGAGAQSSPAPQIEITFPFSHARYSASSISISGRLVHPQAQAVRVWASGGRELIDGIVIGDRFAIAAVPLATGARVTVTVSAAHPAGPTSTRSFTLSREPELTNVPQMVLDAARSRMLMVDIYTSAVIAQPLDGGPRVTISDANVGSGPRFAQPVALTLDPAGDVLYVADDELNAILRVDLATGDRTLTSGEHVIVAQSIPTVSSLPVAPPEPINPQPGVTPTLGGNAGAGIIIINPQPPNPVSTVTVGSGPAIGTPKEMDFDAARGVIVLADENNGVMIINPQTGDRTLFNAMNATGDRIYAHRSIAVDPVRNSYVVSDGGSVFRVDRSTGHRTLFSSVHNDPVSRFIYGTSIATGRDLLYIGEDMTNGVASINLTDGTRTTITAAGLPPPWNFAPVGDGPIVQYPNDVVFDPSQERLFMMEGEYADPLMQVASNGDRSLIRDASLGAGPHLRHPSGIKFDKARASLLIADYIDDYVLEVDPVTGNRSTIQAPVNGRGSIDSDPLDVDYDAASGLFYVVDWVQSSLYSVNAATGVRTVLADATTGTGPKLYRPAGVQVHASRRVVYVLDMYSPGIFIVNLDTLARSYLGEFSAPTAMALDRANDLLYVGENGGAIHRVNLSDSTEQQIVQGSSYSYAAVRGLAFDDVKERLIAIDDFPVRVYSVDLASGERALIADRLDTVPGEGPKILWPGGLALDSQRQVAYVTESALDAVVAVDLATGARQVIAK